MVIFHSCVSLPEGAPPLSGQPLVVGIGTQVTSHLSLRWPVGQEFGTYHWTIGAGWPGRSGSYAMSTGSSSGPNPRIWKSRKWGCHPQSYSSKGPIFRDSLGHTYMFIEGTKKGARTRMDFYQQHKNAKKKWEDYHQVDTRYGSFHPDFLFPSEKYCLLPQFLLMDIIVW
jgi:hypothetical protein